MTRQDEEIQVREAELQKAKDKLTRVEQDYTDLDRKHAQVNKPPSYSADPFTPFSPYTEITLLAMNQSLSHHSLSSSVCHVLADGGEGSAR